MLDIDLIENFYTNLWKCRKDFSLYEKEIKLACDFAKIAHQWQTRRYSWEPYIIHPLEVALDMAQKTKDKELIISSILHDTVEDSEKIKISDIYKNFGSNIWFIVDCVSDNILSYYNNTKIFSDKIEKILWWWMQNIKCIILKLTDRENNLKTLQSLSKEKQIRMSFETQAIYIPLKQILEDFDNLSLCKNKFENFIKKNNIKNEKELKNKLFSQTFDDFDNETYNLTYKNTNFICRQIEQKEVLDSLLKIEEFNNKINIVETEYDTNGFVSCCFRYKQWYIFSDIVPSLSIKSGAFISS